MKRISLICLVIVSLLLVGCSKETKEVKTLDDFKIAATGVNYSVEDHINDYRGDNNVDYITGSYLAINGNSTVEMVIYDDENSAKKAYKNMVKTFKTMKASGATANITKGGNYQTYNMISNGYYMIVSRVDNTMVFSRTTMDTKEAIDNIFNSMGY